MKKYNNSSFLKPNITRIKWSRIKNQSFYPPKNQFKNNNKFSHTFVVVSFQKYSIFSAKAIGKWQGHRNQVIKEIYERVK